MTAKNDEMKNIIQIYQDLERRYNQLGQNFPQMEQNHMQQMGQYEKDVTAEAFRLMERITKEKDQEIQQLTDELNRYRYKPGEWSAWGNDSFFNRNGRGNTKTISRKS